MTRRSAALLFLASVSLVLTAGCAGDHAYLDAYDVHPRFEELRLAVKAGTERMGPQGQQLLNVRLYVLHYSLGAPAGLDGVLTRVETVRELAGEFRQEPNDVVEDGVVVDDDRPRPKAPPALAAGGYRALERKGDLFLCLKAGPDVTKPWAGEWVIAGVDGEIKHRVPSIELETLPHRPNHCNWNPDAKLVAFYPSINPLRPEPMVVRIWDYSGETAKLAAYSLRYADAFQLDGDKYRPREVPTSSQAARVSSKGN